MARRQVIAGLGVAASLYALSLTMAAQGAVASAGAGRLALADFKGYEDWQTIAPSQTDDGIKAILGNRLMIEAYRAGFPANGKAAPDGAMIAKIEWAKKSNDASPYAVVVPDALKSASFMVKDAKRFKDSGGWGYAQFKYDAASKTFAPAGADTGCGYACHTRVKARDFVFTSYPRR